MLCVGYVCAVPFAATSAHQTGYDSLWFPSHPRPLLQGNRAILRFLGTKGGGAAAPPDPSHTNTSTVERRIGYGGKRLAVDEAALAEVASDASTMSDGSTTVTKKSAKPKKPPPAKEVLYVKDNHGSLLNFQAREAYFARGFLQFYEVKKPKKRDDSLAKKELSQKEQMRLLR